MKVTIDRNACIGCGACAATCPENFEVDDENKSVSKHTVVPKELEECVEKAADSCPVSCIKISE